MQCGKCYQHKERDPRFVPICHTKGCSVSQVMLEAYQPYIEMFYALYSEFAGRSGMADYTRRAAKLGPEEVELFLEMEGAILEQQNEKRKVEREQRNVKSIGRR